MDRKYKQLDSKGLFCLTCGEIRWVCKCDFPRGERRSWGPLISADAGQPKLQNLARADEQGDIGGPSRPPELHDFGLTVELVRNLTNEFTFSDSQYNRAFFLVYAVAFFYYLLSAPDFSVQTLLHQGMLAFGVGFAASFLVYFGMMFVEHLRMKFHTRAVKRLPEYLQYQKYLAAKREFEHQLRIAEQSRKEHEERERRRQREERRKQLAWWQDLDGLRFERELGELLRKQGYIVWTTPPSGDQGVDLFLEKNGRKVIVQCKAHKNYVSPGAVRELFGTLTHFKAVGKADEAWLVTTSGFHTGAVRFARDKPIRLLKIAELLWKPDREDSSD